MDSLLSGWLSDLERTPLRLGTAPGSGGAENLWSVAIPSERAEIGEEELMRFLREAQRVRLSQAIAMGAGSVVFYVWHDEMAGQLRFSVARGTVADLSFAARVEQVSDLGVVVRSYLMSENRNGIPWRDFADVPVGSANSPAEDNAVQVWACGLP